MITYTLTVGDFAYIDTFAGLVSCKVTSVADDLESAEVRVTTNRHNGYKAGEIVEARPNQSLLHRKQVYQRDGQLHVRGVVRLTKDKEVQW